MSVPFAQLLQWTPRQGLRYLETGENNECLLTGYSYPTNSGYRIGLLIAGYTDVWLPVILTLSYLSLTPATSFFVLRGSFVYIRRI